MSSYGLIKITSRIQRGDTITDLYRINQWRIRKGLHAVPPGGPSLRELENSVALAIYDIDHSDCPELVRGKSFYLSVYNEIKKR